MINEVVHSYYTVEYCTCIIQFPCPSRSLTYFRWPPKKYIWHIAETESVPNVWILSAEAECLPKVLICPHSATKPKPKPKFGRPLRRAQLSLSLLHRSVTAPSLWPLCSIHETKPHVLYDVLLNSWRCYTYRSFAFLSPRKRNDEAWNVQKRI